MGSSRLPGKIFKMIGSRSLLGNVLGRLQSLKTPYLAVVATTDQERDDCVERFCIEEAVECFRGSEDNVLERYYKCASLYNFAQIVRLTADNPFTDIVELDRLIELHLSGSFEFSYSFDQLPLGAGAEIFSFSALERSYYKAESAYHREHVDEYVLDYPEKFKIARLSVPEQKGRPDLRLTVDTLEDLHLARYIVEHSQEEWVRTEEAIQLAIKYSSERKSLS